MSTPTAFTYEALPMRVRFEAGSVADVAAELEALGLHKALVLCTPEQRGLAEMVLGHLGDRGVGIFDDARMHVPVGTVARAVEEAARLNADCCVAIGGGSTVGLGKGIALERNLPIVAIPTTYAGSEMTPVWGLTADKAKKTGKDRRVLPRSVVYDPELTTSLPIAVSAASGLNAIAHAVEALYAPDSSPIIALMAEEGVRSFVHSLPAVVADAADLRARSQALYGAWLCGACLGATTMSLHHKLCHVLGGSLDLPHAQTHAVVLPYVLAYNENHAPTARAALQRALDTDHSPALALWDLAQQFNIPHSLRDLDVRESDLDNVIAAAVKSPYANPAEVTEDGLRHLLTGALSGMPPTAP